MRVIGSSPLLVSCPRVCHNQRGGFYVHSTIGAGPVAGNDPAVILSTGRGWLVLAWLAVIAVAGLDDVIQVGRWNDDVGSVRLPPSRNGLSGVGIRVTLAGVQPILAIPNHNLTATD
jgi:hypothetical protein